MEKQTRSDNCVCACIAYLTGKPVQEITDLYHSDLWSNRLNISDILEAEELNFKMLSPEQSSVYPGTVYLACVPSLNLPGSFHAIIIDTRSDEVEVLDPAEEGKERYSPDNLTSWILQYQIELP